MKSILRKLQHRVNEKQINLKTMYSVHWKVAQDGGVMGFPV